MKSTCYFLLALALLVVAPTAFAQNGGTPDHETLEFSNDIEVPIPDSGCPTMIPSLIAVDESFDWINLEVGVQIQHTWRGDLWIQLESPEGTFVNLLARPGTGGFGTNGDNLDALFTDDGPAGVFGSPDNHTLGTPPFQVEGQTEAGAPAEVEADPISDFDGEDPEGVWTLHFCDGAGGDTGALQQWALFFTLPHVGSENTALSTHGFVLEPAYPNPFSASTVLSLYVQQSQNVRAEVYDALGRRVQHIDLGMVAAEAQSALTVDAGSLTSGVYVVRVVGETFSTAQRVMLVR